MDNPLHYTIYQEKWEWKACEKLPHNLRTVLKLYTYFLFDGLYLIGQLLVGFQFILNFIHTVDNCGVVFFAEKLPDIDVRSIGELAAKVHDDLPGLDKFGVPLFGSNV